MAKVSAPGLKSRVRDFFLKLLSVKGFVFFVATALLLLEKINAEQWMWAAGGLVVVRAVEKKLWNGDQ